jgi:hypothetical protein
MTLVMARPPRGSPYALNPLDGWPKRLRTVTALRHGMRYRLSVVRSRLKP